MVSQRTTLNPRTSSQNARVRSSSSVASPMWENALRAMAALLSASAGREQVPGDRAHQLDRLPARKRREHGGSLPVRLARDDDRLDAERVERLGDDHLGLYYVRPRPLQ